MSAAQPTPLPPLNDELRFILGSPCFAVASIAQRLHDLGLYQVEPKAEAEQAAAIHWMLNLYLTYGDSWRQEADRILKGI